MELKKGQNMIEHEQEIYSRPARTWFQSGQEKLKAEGLTNNPLSIHAMPKHKFTAVSKKSYEAGFDVAGVSKQNKEVDETKVCLFA